VPSASKDSKARDDSFGQQREEKRRAYAEALSVRERFPRAEQLVIEMAFVDPKSLGRYSAQMRSFSGSAKAFFAFPCPRTLCLHGGFDLDPLIAALLRSHQPESSGILECRGWVHPEHTENARCLLQLHYRLQVAYQVQNVASTTSGRARG